MAGPVFRAVGARSQSASAASIAPAKPTVDGASGLLLCVVTSKNNAVHSCATSGWSLVGQVNSGASFTASLWKAKESAGAPTITWTGAAACSAQIVYHADPANEVSLTLGASTNNNGTTSTHSTSAVTTSNNNSLVVYVDAAAANTGLATPSGWTENSDTGSGTDAGETTFGSKANATSGTSSGAISVTGANAAWVMWQVEIGGVGVNNAAEFSKAELAAWEEPAVGAAFAKAELGAWEEPAVGAAFAKAEFGAWIDAPNEADFSKAELGAWLDYVGGAARRRQGSIVN